jgi:NAD(P)-dependent dehydrogenase (short-subunit alcohol dehydrogenase family)
MTMSMDGRVAVVTGGGSGIGQACGVALAEAGAAVALLDRDGEAAGQTAASITAAGGNATSYEVDVTDESAIHDAMTSLQTALGPPRMLVNAAGIAVRKGLLDTTPEEWRRVLDVNLTGYFLMLREAVPAMAEAGGGSIVQIASITAHLGYGYPSYTAAKGGVLSMTRQLAGELAPMGIRINSVSPGVVQTGLNRESLANAAVLETTVQATPSGRIGHPEEVARAVQFLLEDGADFITGSDLVIDGGMISRINFGGAGQLLTNFHATEPDHTNPA